MKKLGAPDGRYCVGRPLTPGERKVTGLGRRWWIERDNTGNIQLNEYLPSGGYNTGYLKRGGPEYTALYKYWEES